MTNVCLWCVFAWLSRLLVLARAVASARNPDGVREYCRFDRFNATCRSNEVIVMESAKYGRMRMGRCLSRDYYLGCGSDVINTVDTRCSGKHHCGFDIPDEHLYQKQPCPKDLATYFEASYNCIPVETNTVKKTCFGGVPLTVSQTSGYLASRITNDNDYGSGKCPWSIELPVGQKVNISLYDFSTKILFTKGPNKGSNICRVYAIIQDGSKTVDIRVCGYVRNRYVYTSRSNRVTISLLTKNEEDDENSEFLIQYQAIGCPRLEPPVNAQMRLRHRGTIATIFCNATGETWHLVCRDTRWIGEFRNCSKTTLSKKQEAVTFLGKNGVYPYGLFIAIGIGVILGIVIGIVLLVFVLVFKRRSGRAAVWRTESNSLLRTTTPSAQEEKIYEIKPMPRCCAESLSSMGVYGDYSRTNGTNSISLSTFSAPRYFYDSTRQKQTDLYDTTAPCVVHPTCQTNCMCNSNRLATGGDTGCCAETLITTSSQPNSDLRVVEGGYEESLCEPGYLDRPDIADNCHRPPSLVFDK